MHKIIHIHFLVIALFASVASVIFNCTYRVPMGLVYVCGSDAVSADDRVWEKSKPTTKT